jgi:hypothetical protein
LLVISGNDGTSAERLASSADIEDDPSGRQNIPASPMTTPLRRFFAALFALWFTVLTVEPARVHSCPTHGGLAAGSEHAHAGHSGHGAHGSAPAKRHGCNCLGSCATPAAPPSPRLSFVRFAVITADAPGLEELERPITSVAYAIPFGNGPPRA